MLLAFHRSLSGGEPARWPESAQLAGAAGYDAVDIDLRDVAGEPVAALRDVLDGAGVVAATAQLPVEFRRDEETFRRDAANLPALAALAADLGITTLYRSIPASSDTPPDDLRRTLKRRLAACLPVLRENGLSLAIEPIAPLHLRQEGRYRFAWRLRDAAALAEEIGPGTGVLADAWHWHHARETAAELAALGGRILHVHVADAPDVPPEAIRDEERLLPGAGVVDFAAFAAGLEAAGYSGFVSPEVTGYDCGLGDRTACAARAREAARTVLPALK